MNDRWIILSRACWWCLGAAAIAASSGFATPADSAGEAPADSNDHYMRVVEEPGRSITLEVAARTFAKQQQQPDGLGGPTITLVAVAHVGEKHLYDAVQKLLDRHDVVLYESVMPPGTDGAGGTDDQQRIESTEAAMRFVAGILAAHRQARQQYPADLDALIRFATERDPRMKQWLATALADAWGGRIAYCLEGDGEHFVLVSLGADGRVGGEGPDADLRVADEAPIHPEALGRADDNLQAELAKALGLAFQLEALRYDRPNFRCSDMAMDQLERALREKGVDFEPIRGSLAGSSLPGRLAVFILRLIRAADVFFEGAIADAMKVVLIEMLGDEAVIEQSLKQFGRGFQAVIIDQRNQVVVDDVKTILQRERDVNSIAILYGAGHMPDMAERLAEQLGYRPTGEQWFTAFEVDLKQSAITAAQLQRIRWMVKQQLRQLRSPAPEDAEQ